MGLYQSLYLAPYIEIPITKTEHTVTLYGCKDHPYQNGKHCQICGNKTGDYETTKEFYNWVNDLIGEEYEDDFIHIEKDELFCLFSNYSIDGIRLETEAEKVQEITIDNVAKCKNVFTEHHKGAIEKLEAHFKTKLIVKFGFLNHHS